jgi:hypothetical protein
MLACAVIPVWSQVPTATLTPPPTFDMIDPLTPIEIVTAVPTVIPNTATPNNTTPTPTATFFTDTPQPTETLPPTLDMPYADESAILQGVCFAYLQSLDGQALEFNSSGDLSTFYDTVNKSKKCPEVSARRTFDFSSRQLIGTVVTGQGCGIVLSYGGTTQDSGTHDRAISIHAELNGSCPYLLVQPILLSVDRQSAGNAQVVVTKQTAQSG